MKGLENCRWENVFSKRGGTKGDEFGRGAESGLGKVESL